MESLLLTAGSVFVGAMIGFLTSRHYAKQAEADLQKQVDDLRRLIGSLELVLTDRATKLGRDEQGLPTGRAVVQLSARIGATVGARAKLTVRSPRLYDDAGFKRIEEDLDRRIVEVDRLREKRHPDWSKVLFP